jgi:hypothetical protein
VGRSDFKSEWGSQPVPGGFDSHSLPPQAPGHIEQLAAAAAKAAATIPTAVPTTGEKPASIIMDGRRASPRRATQRKKATLFEWSFLGSRPVLMCSAIGREAKTEPAS